MEDYAIAAAKTGTYVGHVIESGIQEYLGIRYAKPVQRWKRAELPDPSSRRILALADNPACYQKVEHEEFPAGDPPMSEDCLYLNVWTSGTEGKKPVYVFIHGGSYVTGSCRTDCYGGVYCGDRFVAHYPDIVYVNIEYRTGPVGSMDLSRFEGGEEYAGSANLQIHDQALAIRWVHENIAAFGGDPDRITIGGQSAGSYSAYILMAMPEVAGMIKGVIAESTAVTDNVLVGEIESAKRGFDRFFELAGCKTLQDALDLPVEDVVRLGWDAKFAPGCTSLFGPICDGSDLTDKVEAVWESGACRHISLLSGTVAGEFATNAVGRSPEEVAEMIKEMFPDVTAADMEAYLANDPDREAHEAMEDMLNDLLIRAAQSKATECVVRGGSKAWTYYIDYKPAGAKMRAQHCFELPYIADKLDCGLYLDERTGETLLGDKPDEGFGRKIREAWHNFIVSGDPNGPGLGMEWPQYGEGRTTMVMGPEWKVQGEVRPADLDIARKFN